MAKLIYGTNVTLDCYIEDARGAFDWFPPDADVFRSTTDLLRSACTFLYGPRGQLRLGLANSQEGSSLHYPGRVVDRQHPNRAPPRPTAVREMKVAANSDIT